MALKSIRLWSEVDGPLWWFEEITPDRPDLAPPPPPSTTPEVLPIVHEHHHTEAVQHGSHRNLRGGPKTMYTRAFLEELVEASGKDWASNGQVYSSQASASKMGYWVRSLLEAYQWGAGQDVEYEVRVWANPFGRWVFAVRAR